MTLHTQSARAEAAASATLQMLVLIRQLDHEIHLRTGDSTPMQQIGSAAKRPQPLPAAIVDLVPGNDRRRFPLLACVAPVYDSSVKLEMVVVGGNIAAEASERLEEIGRDGSGGLHLRRRQTSALLDH